MAAPAGIQKGFNEAAAGLNRTYKAPYGVRQTPPEGNVTTARLHMRLFISFLDLIFIGLNNFGAENDRSG